MEQLSLRYGDLQTRYWCAEFVRSTGPLTNPADFKPRIWKRFYARKNIASLVESVHCVEYFA
jgi:hypothetical protein